MRFCVQDYFSVNRLIVEVYQNTIPLTWKVHFSKWSWSCRYLWTVRWNHEKILRTTTLRFECESTLVSTRCCHNCCKKKSLAVCSPVRAFIGFDAVQVLSKGILQIIVYTHRPNSLPTRRNTSRTRSRTVRYGSEGDRELTDSDKGHQLKDILFKIVPWKLPKLDS